MKSSHSSASAALHAREGTCTHDGNHHHHGPGGGSSGAGGGDRGDGDGDLYAHPGVCAEMQCTAFRYLPTQTEAGEVRSKKRWRWSRGAEGGGGGGGSIGHGVAGNQVEEVGAVEGQVEEAVVTALRGYRYDGEDQSAISVAMTPFWEWCTRSLVPKWMAPNLLTLAGFLCVISSFVLLVCLYSPRLHDEGGPPTPSWVYAYTAIMLFIYQTIDAVDGKHARATGTMSAVGELTDHGGDSLVVVLQCAVLCHVVQLGGVASSAALWTLGVFISVYTNAYLVMWEDFLTGTMRLSAVGPTEAIVLVMAFLSHAAAFGTQHYTAKWMQVIPASWLSWLQAQGRQEAWWTQRISYAEDWTVVQVCLLLVMLVMALGSTATVLHVATKLKSQRTQQHQYHGKQKKEEDEFVPEQTLQMEDSHDGKISSNHNNGEKEKKKAVYTSLLPYMSGVVLFALWAWSASSQHLFSRDNRYTLLVFLCSFGLHSSYCQVRCIFARVTGQKIPPLYRITIPLFFITAYSVIAHILTWVDTMDTLTAMLYAYFAVLIATYAHFVYFGFRECLIVLNMCMFSQRRRHGKGTVAKLM